MLTIRQWTEKDDILVLQLLGRFLHEDQETFKSFFRHKKSRIVVDLGTLTKLSPEGLVRIIAIRREYENAVFVEPQVEQVIDLLEQTGLKQILKPFSTLEEAIASLNE